MLKMLKDSEYIVKRVYVYNMRIFTSEKVKVVLLNSLIERKVIAHYYYLPEKIYIGMNTYRIGERIKRHEQLYRTIITEIKRITDDEIYRNYRFTQQVYYSKKRERQE